MPAQPRPLPVYRHLPPPVLLKTPAPISRAIRASSDALAGSIAWPPGTCHEPSRIRAQTIALPTHDAVLGRESFGLQGSLQVLVQHGYEPDQLVKECLILT
jgi:hypothetical protein